MRTLEELMVDGERAQELIFSGESYLRYARKLSTFSPQRSKKQHSKGMLLLNRGEARLKSLQSEADRLRKREKIRRKYAKIVTLTEVLGRPWRVLIKK